MCLAEHDHVIEAFASNRADQPLDVAVLPWRARRYRMIADAHRTDPMAVNWTERVIAVAYQMPRRFIPRKSVGHLSRNPFGRWDWW